MGDEVYMTLTFTFLCSTLSFVCCVIFNKVHKFLQDIEDGIIPSSISLKTPQNSNKNKIKHFCRFSGVVGYLNV